MFRSLKHKLFFLLLSLVIIKAMAQQDPMYSLYTQDKMLINPAYVGSSNWAVGSLKYRAQMVGLDGAPVTQTFNFHAPIQKKHIGLGVKVIHDQVAVVKTTSAHLTVSYHMGLAGGKLSFGLEGGMINQSIDFTKLVAHDPADNAILNGSGSVLVPDFNFGTLYHKKNFYIGFSDYHLTQEKLKYVSSSQASMYNHQFYYMGYVLDLNEHFALEPSVLVKSVAGAPIQCDFNCFLNYMERFALGASYRTGDGIVGVFKYNITENLRIAYAYDYALTPISNYSGGSHEILLSYGIKLLPPPAEKEIHPRYYF